MYKELAGIIKEYFAKAGTPEFNEVLNSTVNGYIVTCMGIEDEGGVMTSSFIIAYDPVDDVEFCEVYARADESVEVIAKRIEEVAKAEQELFDDIEDLMED